jgi:hypothetical protein
MAPQIFLFILSSYLSKLLYLIGLKAPKEKISSNFFLFFNTSSHHMHSPLSGMRAWVEQPAKSVCITWVRFTFRNGWGGVNCLLWAMLTFHLLSTTLFK